MSESLAEKIDAFLFRFLGIAFGGGGCIALVVNNDPSKVVSSPAGLLFFIAFAILGAYSLTGFLRDLLTQRGRQTLSGKGNRSAAEKTEEHPEEPWMLKEYIKAGVVAILLALFIRTYIAQAFKIPSESMVHTLLVGDHLLVNKLVYLFSEPERGDIIVFQYPQDRSRDFVKRVIGLPGETLELKNKTIYINGKPIDEPYAIYYESHFIPAGDESFGPVLIPKGRLFMMGDNRNNSQDSRVWGTLDINLVHGKAFIVHWSWSGASFGIRWGRVGSLLE